MATAKDSFIESMNPQGQCPCGSGLVYAKCHMPADRGIPVLPMPPSAQHLLQVAQAKEEMRKKQQGLGKPIISVVHRDQRFVAVGNELMNSKDIKTFHDFLSHYVRSKFGAEWAEVETRRPLEERHLLLVWYDKLRAVFRSHEQGDGEVFSTAMTGAISAFMRLAYNLYLLQHNADLQELLLVRLRQREQFLPAFYETLVAAAFIRAGFQLDLERENDPRSTHCEFTATWPATGKKFSVEAKMRQAGKADANVRNQLYEALKKAADHQRVIFVEMGYPVERGHEPELESRFEEASRSIIAAQSTMKIRGTVAPSAYVILTNHPWVHVLDGIAAEPVYAGQGFKLDRFQFDPGPRTLETIVDDRDHHIEMNTLVDSMNQHREVPSTFDGEAPELAYAKKPFDRLIIGERYEGVPLGEGRVGGGVLEDAVVVEIEKAATCIYRTDEGMRIMVKAPLTDDELSAHARYSSAVFGKHMPKLKGERPIDFYDWIHDTYSQSSREMLLEMMKQWPNQEGLARMSQAELAKRYSLVIADQGLQRIYRAQERSGQA